MFLGGHAHLALVFALLLRSAGPDTFTNTATGEVVRGALVVKAVVDGKPVLIVKDAAGTVRALDADTWRQAEAQTVSQDLGPAPQPPAKDFKGAIAHSVVRVVDGDTVVLLLDGKQTTVRLIGVDTPETVDPRKPVQAYGKEATAFLTNLLKGEAVYVEYEPGPSKLDKYGRTLAYLYRAPDGLFVNLEIVRQGYGHAYTVFPFQHMDLFRAYERRAREARKGLWAPEVSGATAPSGATDTGAETAKPTVAPPAQNAQDQTVYITKTGAKYHRAGRRYLSKSSIPISLKHAKARGYAPCSVCRPPD